MSNHKRRIERLEAQTQAQRQAQSQAEAPWYVAGQTEEEVDAKLEELRAAGVDLSQLKKIYVGVSPDWR